MRKIISIALAAVSFSSLSLLPPVGAHAAESDTSTNSPLEITITSASRIEQPIEEVGSTVTVLDGEELRSRGVTLVTDALREIPSAVVTSSGPRGSFTQIRFRGSEANHVLILIDGVRVSDASSGEFDISSLSLNGIEKIEVLSGPQSTLYGSDAAAGVISITTLKGRKTLEGHVSATIETLGTRATTARVTGSKKGWHYAVSASDYTTSGISEASAKNGNTETDGFDLESVSIKAGYDHKAYKTWVTFNKTRARHDIDSWSGGMAVDDATLESSTDTDTVSWVIDFPYLNKRLNNRVQVSNSQYESYSKTDRDIIDYQGSFKLTNNHTFQYGLEHVTEALETGSLDKDIDTSGTYLQYLTRLGSTNLSLGTRNDDHEQYGEHNTWRITVSHSINEQWRLRSVYGTGFKAPTLFELYDATYGSPDLKPEETASFELGMEYRDANYKTQVTVLRHTTKNLIRFSGGKNINVNRAENVGLELGFNGSFGKTDISTALTWLDAEETNSAGISGERQRVPELAGQLTATYYQASSKLWAQAIYQDKRIDSINTVDAYTIYNAGISYNTSNDITYIGKLENLTDKEYEEIYSYGTRGRTFSLTVDWKF